MSRKPISAATRFAIMRRDGFRCRYCGRSAAHIELVLDHVVPFSRGGRCDETNLVTACIECNAGKSATPLTAEEASYVLPPAEHVLRELYEIAMRRFPSLAESFDSKVLLMFMLRDAEMSGVQMHELRRAVERCETSFVFLEVMSTLSPGWASWARANAEMKNDRATEH